MSSFITFWGSLLPFTIAAMPTHVEEAGVHRLKRESAVKMQGVKLLLKVCCLANNCVHCHPLQAQLGQISLQLTREFVMTALDYLKAVQAAEQAASPAATPVVLTPVKQVCHASIPPAVLDVRGEVSALCRPVHAHDIAWVFAGRQGCLHVGDPARKQPCHHLVL